MSTTTTLTDMRSAVRTRSIGLLVFLAGIGMSWFFGILPLQQAEAGVAQLSVEPKIFMAGPAFIMFGLALLIGGSYVGHAMSSPPRTRVQHLLVWPLFAAAIISGAMAYVWFTERLHELGYTYGY